MAKQSQQTPQEKPKSGTKKKAAAITLGAIEYAKVVPAWMLSLILHATLLATMAAITYRIETVPEMETAVEVVMSSKDETGRLEYLDRKRLEVEQTSSGGSMLSETVEKSALNQLEDMVREREESLNVFAVDVGSNLSSTNFTSLGFASGYKGPSASFGEEVAKLKKVGLNVVFAFDSTGSMDLVIKQTQEQIDYLMEIIFDLVPKARIGLVTYRDRGEAYITKSLPLTNNRRRIREWLYKIRANGGGDAPEAVDKALKVAFNKMPWQRRAKRIVLLFGDAEPHPHTFSAVLRSVKQFRDKGGTVSTIVTDVGGPATAPFEEIAEAGGGENYPIGSSKEIVKRLLVLAFGSRWEKYLNIEFKKLLESKN